MGYKREKIIKDNHDFLMLKIKCPEIVAGHSSFKTISARTWIEILREYPEFHTNVRMSKLSKDHVIRIVRDNCSLLSYFKPHISSYDACEIIRYNQDVLNSEDSLLAIIGNKSLLGVPNISHLLTALDDSGVIKLYSMFEDYILQNLNKIYGVGKARLVFNGLISSNLLTDQDIVRIISDAGTSMLIFKYNGLSLVDHCSKNRAFFDRCIKIMTHSKKMRYNGVNDRYLGGFYDLISVCITAEDMAGLVDLTKLSLHGSMYLMYHYPSIFHNIPLNSDTFGASEKDILRNLALCSPSFSEDDMSLIRWDTITNKAVFISQALNFSFFSGTVWQKNINMILDIIDEHGTLTEICRRNVRVAYDTSRS